jgi:CHAT domain-containing protein/tetratricopeptide (TPR) repeat protein
MAHRLWTAILLPAIVSPFVCAQPHTKEEILAGYNRARQLVTEGKHADAVKVLEPLVPSTEFHAGKTGHNLAVILELLADAHMGLSRPDKALPLYIRCIGIFETNEGKDAPHIASLCNDVGRAYQALGKYDAAEPFYARGLVIEEKRGVADLKLAGMLNNMGSVKLDLGEFGEAEKYMARSLQIYESQLDKEDVRLTLPLGNLALVCHLSKQHVKAESLYLRTLALCEKKRGPEHLQSAFFVYTLGTLYHDMGLYGKAAPLYERALGIREKQLGKDHDDVARVLNSQAMLLRDLGQFEKAEAQYKRAIAIGEAALGVDHPDVITRVNNLANNYREWGQREKALTLFQRTLKAREAVLGKNHQDVAQSLHNLGILYTDLGLYEDADPLLRRNLDIMEMRYGKDHPQTVGSLLALAWNDAFMERHDKAVALVDRARHIRQQEVAQVLPVLSEAEQIAYIENSFESSLHIALSLGVAAADKHAARGAEWILNSRAVLHQALAQRHLQARDSRTPELRDLLRDLDASRIRLARLTNHQPKPGEEAAYRKELHTLQAKEQGLAEALARALGRQHRADPWVRIDEVRGALPADAVFVDIARFVHYEFSGRRVKSDHYVAWVAPPRGKGDVRVIDLGEADVIDRLVNEMRESLFETAKKITMVGEIEAFKAFERPLDALSAKVLHPLLPVLEKHAQWIICPDGALWLMPWSALRLPKGDFAVEKHVVRHVVSGRDLLVPAQAADAMEAHVFADPDYDAGAEKVLTVTDKKPGVAHAELREAPLAAKTLPRVARLPGTALEAEAIRPHLEKWLGREPQIHFEAQASEARVRAVARPRLLVFATRGYFLPRQERVGGDPAKRGVASADAARKSATVDKEGQVIENPLLRCGLLFAGCNQRTLAKPGDDDGILTGLEIVGMDLRGTELVVLSACDTGLGDIRAGEGVVGLRQAFQLAGARGVLASLWKVPDRETALLMNAFYSQWTENKSRASALREAQLARIASRRSTYGAAHPFFWAAFTLTSQGK